MRTVNVRCPVLGVAAASLAAALALVWSTAPQSAAQAVSPQASATCHGNGVKACPTTSTTSTTTTPTSSTTTTVTGWACTAPLGGGCGGYDYAGIPMSSIYTTGISNQDVGANSGTTQTLYANNPGDWQVVADAVPYGYLGVQTFPDVQQLFNNWTGTDWNCGSAACSDTKTPLDSLSTLAVTYAETSPQDPLSIYQFSPDLWLDNYGSDIMFWVDVHGRCDEGAFGGTVLGHTVIDGQGWTVHRYGNAGAEIIFVLDGPGGAGTCANQSSGTINVKAGVDWLVAGGFVQGAPVVAQLNTGWEITSADNTTFQVTGYSIEAVPL